MPDIDLLTAADVCKVIDVHPRTLRRMVAAGEFPRPLERNRRWKRWKPEDVLTYLRQLEQSRQLRTA